MANLKFINTIDNLGLSLVYQDFGQWTSFQQRFIGSEALIVLKVQGHFLALVSL